MSKVTWRIKLMALFILVLGISLLSQVFYVIPYFEDREVEMAEKNQEEIARNIGRELDLDILDIEDILIKIAEREEFRNMDFYNQTQTMNHRLETSRCLTSLFVMNATGWFISGTVENLSAYTTKSYADRPSFTVPFEQDQVDFWLPRFYPQIGIVGTSVSVPIESDRWSVST